MNRYIDESLSEVSGSPVRTPEHISIITSLHKFKHLHIQKLKPCAFQIVRHTIRMCLRQRSSNLLRPPSLGRVRPGSGWSV